MPTSAPQTPPAEAPARAALPVALLLYMLGVGLYFVRRYNGQWAEADSAAFTEIIRSFQQAGRIVPSQGALYPNGYAYQAISVWVLTLTGLDATTLQQAIYPLTAALVVLPAWALYRELTGSARGATIASLLLFTQPELLFVILRSSHEKFTRALLLLCLFLLVRSFTVRDQPRRFAIYVSLFYLSSFAMITSNNLLAHSFIIAVTIALVLGLMLAWRNPSLRQHSGQLLPRLCYATVVCLGLVYLFTFYIYAPAQHDLLILRSVGERIAAMFLDVEAQTTTASNATALAGWISRPVYFLVSIANWIILAASFVIWVRQGLRWLWDKQPVQRTTDWLLWLLYAAFAAQGSLSIVSDATGALGGNLQHRLFPSFSIIAVGIVGAALARWRPGRVGPLARLGYGLAVTSMALLSVLKASNEPLLSNKWTFYQPDELRTLQWLDQHLEHRESWTEFDERLGVALLMAHGPSARANRFIGGTTLPPTAQTILVTPITRLRSRQINMPLPLPPDALRVYDSGGIEVYRRRPRSIFHQ